jgi:hypothetical protein
VVETGGFSSDPRAVSLGSGVAAGEGLSDAGVFGLASCWHVFLCVGND